MVHKLQPLGFSEPHPMGVKPHSNSTPSGAALPMNGPEVGLTAAEPEPHEAFTVRGVSTLAAAAAFAAGDEETAAVEGSKGLQHSSCCLAAARCISGYEPWRVWQEARLLFWKCEFYW